MTTIISATMPTKATSSFLCTVARERLTARTRGSVARVSIWGRWAAISASVGRVSDLRGQYWGGGDQLGDQPLAVDAGHFLVRSNNHRHRLVVRIDVMALEVERAPVL